MSHTDPPVATNRYIINKTVLVFWDASVMTRPMHSGDLSSIYTKEFCTRRRFEFTRHSHRKFYEMMVL